MERSLELEISRSQGIATLRAYGHEKPWIGEITGNDPKYRYARQFVGSRTIYKGGNCIVFPVALATLATPRLLEIQSSERGFFVLHLNPAQVVELAPIDEMMLGELLVAKEYARAIIDLNVRERLEAQRAQYQNQIAQQIEHERLSKIEKAALKRREKREKKLALILPANPTRKITFDK